MSKFLLGVVTTLIVVPLGGYLFLRLGFLDLRASRKPSRWETEQAMQFLDASIDRYARPARSPFLATEENLREGLKLYEDHCAVCHGDGAHRESAVGLGLYPPAPQFLEEAPDMPAYQNFFITRNGIRWTGMPGWSRVLSEDQTWKVTVFLSSMDKLPPAVQKDWMPASSGRPGVSAQSGK